MYTKIFWLDVQHLIRRNTGQSIQFKDKDIFICFEGNELDNDVVYFVQLILLGKFHIHKKKWADSKPSFEHFFQKLHQYGNTIRDIKNKKAIKTGSVFEKFLMYR